jgi:hypothetical protein
MTIRCRLRKDPGLRSYERNPLGNQGLIGFIAHSLHVRCRFVAGVSPYLQAMNRPCRRWAGASEKGHYHIAATRGGGFVPRQARPYSAAAARVPTRWNRMASRSHGVVLTRKEPLLLSISISKV